MFGSEPDFFGSFHGVGLLIEPSSNGGGYNHNYDNNVGDLNANATERIPMCGPQLAGNLPLLPQRAMVGSRRALDIVDDGLQDEVLYRRSSSITLPRDSSPYTLAKRAENVRDYKRALYWHTQCIEQGIRAASAVMDVAGLFNKFGKKAEALTFMAQYKHLVPKDRYQGFRRLYERVEYDLNRPAQVAPRMLMVTLLPSESIRDSGMELGDPPQWYSADAIAYLGKLEKGPLNVKLLDRLFPNPEKIEYLAICEADPNTGAQVAYVQFESQSSARKAMVTEKVLCNILVTWPDKMASMLPPPEDAVTDKHVVQDSERW
ncbi:hypothetical protein Pmar_PMAR024367 [Perkinsus marinus ATCC 50983]|uniref:Uncharacterized protein n=1 Tax=Perkinsus marinus (strain ATCC 50983 / TXsc) TaxID=423536 RepID=C5LMM9_PERM5|nr:hypothetical protein Pmar_PMAR024367 [Perkinsus marinus ATCC 50983]EER02046.1 hypothetical protein Pmar_PMAR024367 [Perkinsus marinus ATCC 50983]|eukprot:XP_002769328.1 hypothetical protein Pmar_PMAR024367 [Perkinsus marinus ATCC 50983]